MEVSVDTRLADIQRTMEVGFATMRGEMAILAERDRVAEALHAQQDQDVESLRAKVQAHDKWIAGAYGVASGLSAASGLIVWALNRH